MDAKIMSKSFMRDRIFAVSNYVSTKFLIQRGKCNFALEKSGRHHLVKQWKSTLAVTGKWTSPAVMPWEEQDTTAHRCLTWLQWANTGPNWSALQNHQPVYFSNTKVKKMNTEELVLDEHNKACQAQCYTPMIPVSGENEAGGVHIPGQPRQCSKTLSQN